MPSFSERVSAATTTFNSQLSGFVDLLQSTPADPPRLPQQAIDDLLTIAESARAAAGAITQSFTLIDRTALDIVDMQVRLQGETAHLASALRELGRAVHGQHFVREAFGDSLVALDEAAQLLAASVFPSAVRGLREVNVKLWDFEKIQWKRYTDILTDVVRRERLDPARLAAIEAIANEVKRAFDAVNALLNELAESRAIDGGALRERLEAAPMNLTNALHLAESRLTPAVRIFAPVITASRRVADGVAKLLGRLTVPVLPTHDRLGACGEFIEPSLYDGLSGVQAFALLNILARLQATSASGRPLLDGRAVRITQVFPDRIYFEADRSLITDLSSDPAFEEAPASLHRFKEGSYKQTTFGRGNLQVCFATLAAGRVVVDADIDLYRAAVPHLFGEVFVNTLTGNSTDQYAVRTILDAQDVRPIGGFQLLNV
jgi:hypothetical protein